MRHDDAGEREGADVLGAHVVALLGRGEQRVQHLDRRLEHLDELEHALVRPVERSRVAVGVRVDLRERLELADVHLADERGDVLVVLVARLRLGDGDLADPRRIDLHHAEARDVAAELVEPLEAPGAHQVGEPAPGNSVAVLEHVSHLLRVEKAEGVLEDRADLVLGLQHIDRVDFHERLQALRQRRLAAAHRTEEVEDLLALLQALRGVAEEADDPLDRILHAVELGKGGIDPDGPVHEDPAKARILGGIHDLRVADGRQEPLRSARIQHRVVAAALEVFGKGQLSLAMRFVRAQETCEQITRVKHHASDVRDLTESTILHA